MEEVILKKVNSAPVAPYGSNTIYMEARDSEILDGGVPKKELIVHVSSSDGNNIHSSLSSLEVDTMTASPGEIITVVADISARDALTLIENAFVLVLDTTGDNNTSGGKSLYSYDASGDEYLFLSETDPVGWTSSTSEW